MTEKIVVLLLGLKKHYGKIGFGRQVMSWVLVLTFEKLSVRIMDAQRIQLEEAPRPARPASARLPRQIHLPGGAE